MVEIFKTNVKRRSEAKRLIQHIGKRFPSYKSNFDLTDCDKILRIEGENVLVEELTEFLILSKLRVEILGTELLIYV
jgi:hypothetical protein